MKKLSISLLVMLLIASLFTSCSMGSDDASDVRVKVRLTPSGGGDRMYRLVIQSSR